MSVSLASTIQEVESLFFSCERAGNLERAEALLAALASSAQDPTVLAIVFGERAQAQVLRYDGAALAERRSIAEVGARLAKKALAHDGDNLYANAWAAAAMGIHGMEMGILSDLFYLRDIQTAAEKVLRLDEAYHSAMAHQILGDLYRITPPRPIGMRDYARSLEHLQRARSLSDCPMAKLRLAELYLTVRKPELAREEIRLVLAQEIPERGPRYAERCRTRAREVEKRLPASACYQEVRP